MTDSDSDDIDVDDCKESCPECGADLEAKWSGVECPNCGYTFCL